MPRIPLAFSTAACPAWDLEAVASRAKGLGYDGVELATAPADGAAVRRRFADAGVAIACVGAGAGTDAADLRRAVDAAAALGCRLVRAADVSATTGRGGAAGLALGERLAAVADYAAAAKVTVAVQNAGPVQTSRALWAVLDRLAHPSVAACWDELAAALAGESSAVSVPTLNTRIQHVHVADARLSPPAAVPVGQGDVPIEKLIHRLRGVGYEGHVTVTSTGGVADTEAGLAAALRVLRAWAAPPPPPEAKRKSDAAPSAGTKASPPAAAVGAPKPGGVKPVNAS